MRGSVVACSLLAGCGPNVSTPSEWDTFDLAFVSLVPSSYARTIRLADESGAATLDLATADVRSDNLSWSPDGRRIAYLSESGSPPNVTFTLRAAEPDADLELRAMEMVPDELPADVARLVSWSPDGDHVVVVAPGRSDSFQCNMPGLELWLVALESEMPEAELIASDVDTRAPAWSSEGHGFAYGEHDLVCGDDFSLADFGWDVKARWIDAPDPFGYPTTVVDHGEWAPVWAPHGFEMAYAFAAEDTASVATIVIEDVVNGRTREIAEDACVLTPCAWFPDGARLLAQRICEGQGAPHVVYDIATGEVLEVLPELGSDATLSPDGERIAYVRSMAAGPKVEIYELATGAITDMGFGFAPTWRPG